MKRIYWVILSIIFIVFGACCFLFKGSFQQYEREISILGSLASLFGIIVAIVQAYQAKTVAEVAASASNAAKIASEKTKVAIEDGMAHVKKVISLVDVSQILHIPNEIQDSIQRKEWLRAYEKMRYLKDFMIVIQNSPIVQEDNSFKNEIIQSTQELELRINAFSTGIQSNKDPYAYNRTSELMERIRTQLQTITTKIKFSNSI